MLIYTMLSGCVPLRTRRVSDCAATSPIALLEKRGSVIAASCSLCSRTSRRALMLRHSVTNSLLYCRCSVAEWRRDSGVAGSCSLCRCTSHRLLMPRCSVTMSLLYCRRSVAEWLYVCHVIRCPGGPSRTGRAQELPYTARCWKQVAVLLRSRGGVPDVRHGERN